jgi:hypothetical protein
MAKSPKKPNLNQRPKGRTDLNQLAARIVAEAAGISDRTPDPEARKDPAAVSLGRKGGVARAKKMSKKKRSASAKKAAETRWEMQKSG